MYCWAGVSPRKLIKVLKTPDPFQGILFQPLGWHVANSGDLGYGKGAEEDGDKMRWKLFQLGVFFWILFTLMANQAMSDNRAAQAVVAAIGTRIATDILFATLMLPGRLRDRWKHWRGERATRGQSTR